MSRPEGKDQQMIKGVRKLRNAVLTALTEAAENFPGTPVSKELVDEWVRWTHMMVMELVKRKDTTYSTMLKNAKRVVRRRMERSHADAILKEIFPPLSPPQHPQQGDSESEPEHNEEQGG